MAKKVKKKEEAPVVEEAVVVVSETIEDTENNVEPQVDDAESVDMVEEDAVEEENAVVIDDTVETTAEETEITTETDIDNSQVTPDEGENCARTFVLDAKEAALDALRHVENPDDRFIQDVCNILKITRLKKVTDDAPVKEKKRHHKWNSGTIWKW